MRGECKLPGTAKVDSSPRQLCERCRRPITVCWCQYLPSEPVNVDSVVYILQHPFEESRPLKTAPIAYHALSKGKCHIIKGKFFKEHRYPELAEVMRDPSTILLFPSPDAVDITDLPPCEEAGPYNIVLLDGTWAQAKNIYYGSKMVSWPQKVKIHHTHKSKYVIRTQPNDASLSTLETAALALSLLERKPHIFDILVKPLEALCKFQINYGAVKHDSKVYKIENGLWNKPLPKKILKKKLQEQVQEDSAKT